MASGWIRHTSTRRKRVSYQAHSLAHRACMRANFRLPCANEPSQKESRVLFSVFPREDRRASLDEHPSANDFSADDSRRRS